MASVVSSWQMCGTCGVSSTAASSAPSDKSVEGCSDNEQQVSPSAVARTTPAKHYSPKDRVRPCAHNCWTKESKKRGRLLLRCNKCGAGWKTRAEAHTKCQAFYAGHCPRGDHCPRPHIYAQVRSNGRSCEMAPHDCELGAAAPASQQFPVCTVTTSADPIRVVPVVLQDPVPVALPMAQAAVVSPTHPAPVVLAVLATEVESEAMATPPMSLHVAREHFGEQATGSSEGLSSLTPSMESNAGDSEGDQGEMVWAPSHEETVYGDYLDCCW
eukprot:TRINITY_DN11462_c0_g2_i1.p2 TRINITY_DN11462_c0_g2~~TRINITY_DN11462_c0_g2_i1.p2  ORF type:complete len:271 (+),score=58.99 TRINITY_DN11462_c0_g2_i1:93-905(+)